MTDREKIIQRIKKLKAHAESAKGFGSLQEAEAFALKMQELMDEYAVTAMEVDAAKEGTADEFKNWSYTETISYHESVTDYRWRRELVRVICRYNFTNFTINSGKRTFRVYGSGGNVDNTVWLYHYLSIGLLRLAKEAYKAHNPERLKPYAYYQSFLYGAVEGLRDKLQAARTANAKVNAVILYNDKALMRYVAAKLPHLTVAKQPTVRPLASTAYVKGYEAGNKFDATPSGKKIPKNNQQNIL